MSVYRDRRPSMLGPVATFEGDIEVRMLPWAEAAVEPLARPAPSETIRAGAPLVRLVDDAEVATLE